MSKKLRSAIFRWLRLGATLHRLGFEQRVLKSQIDFMLRDSNRDTRRKWRRILTNKRSPFFIGA